MQCCENVAYHLLEASLIPAAVLSLAALQEETFFHLKIQNRYIIEIQGACDEAIGG